MHAAAIKYAIPRLSDIIIDVDKDWNAKRIANLGAPNSDDDAVARGLVRDIYSSDFGLKWADLGVIATDCIWGMAYLGNGIAILGDEDAHVRRSTDHGATWIDLGAVVFGDICCMAYLGNGIVIIGDVGSHVARSIDYGATWTDLGVIASDSIYGMAYLGNGIAILGDYSGRVYRSTNYGANWTPLGVIAPNIIGGMAYLGNGIAILGDYSGNVYRSTDYGANWTLGVTTCSEVYAIAYLGNGIVVAGCGWCVWRSTDYGVTWTHLEDIATGTIDVMVYSGNGIVILGDYAKHVYRSTDYGVTWTDLGVIASSYIYAMACLDNGIVILGDDAGHVYRSTSAFQLSNFNPNQFDKLFEFGCLGAITPNGTSYLAPGNGATQANEIKARAPRPGILKNLYVWQRVASSTAGWTDIYTVRVNGVDKTITCTLNNATMGSDITHAVLVAAGDQISIKLVSNNAGDTSADVVVTLELT